MVVFVPFVPFFFFFRWQVTIFLGVLMFPSQVGEPVGVTSPLYASRGSFFLPICLFTGVALLCRASLAAISFSWSFPAF